MKLFSKKALQTTCRVVQWGCDTSEYRGMWGKYVFFTSVKTHTLVSHTFPIANTYETLVSQQWSHAFLSAWLRLRTFLLKRRQNNEETADHN